MALDSLKALYVEELRDLYSAETQLLKALPKLAQAASAPELQRAFQKHVQETETQVKRLEALFTSLGHSAGRKTCRAMQGIIEEAEAYLKVDAPPGVRDAALIAAAQRVEHYEIASYGAVRTYARMFNDSKAVRLLQETLDEETNTDKKLTQLAETLINRQASSPAGW